MQWIITGIGLAALAVLAWAARREEPSTEREAALESELTSHLFLIASRLPKRGTARLRLPRNLLGRLEGAIRSLNRLAEDELLPAAKWLCDNGRFLQEEIAALTLALRRAGRLPAAEPGKCRVLCFARELLSHSNGDLRTDRLGEAVSAWQKASPFTVREMDLLPAALRLYLLTMLCDLARLCAREQRAREGAARMARWLEKNGERRAMRLFGRYRHEPAFLMRLLEELRLSGGSERTLWLESYFTQHDLTAEKLAVSEHDHQTDNCLWVGNLITSLRAVNHAPWERLLEEWCAVHRALEEDAVYPTMDQESRAYYRSLVSRVSRKARKPELSVCGAALRLCRAAPEGSVRAHVGYYLLDGGRPSLLQALGAARPRLEGRGVGFFRLFSWLAFAGLLALAAFLALSPLIWLPFAMVFLHAAQQVAICVCQRRVKPRMIPRIQVEALGEELQTLVVCPTMLLSAAHALGMVKRLSILHSANPDPHLHFLLLGDYRDSLTGTLSEDEEIVTTAAAAIRALREDTGHAFYYMQRQRVYHPADHLHMSRERKRGSLESLFKLICGQPTEDTFTYASFPPENLYGRYRYVITLDSDTILPPGSALRMVGAMLHPLQRRGEENGKPRGVSILQPRMEVAAHRVDSLLSLLLGGAGGTDPYNALMADFCHDALRSASYVGKGIVDPAPFLAATADKILPGSVLSHDLLEGQLAGCAYASDIVLYDGNPASLKGFLYRLHRWTRGDWQLLPYLLPLLPPGRRAAGGALSSASRHKLWMNLFRSLVAPMELLLLLYALLAGNTWLLLSALLLPNLTALLPLHKEGALSFLARLSTLPPQALMQLDAIGRALYRLFVSRRRLLEWVTADQISKPTDKPPMLFFYFSMTAAGLAAALCFFARPMYPPGFALAAWWAALPFALPFLEQPYQRALRPTEYMREVLTRLGAGTLLFFETAVTEDDHGLPPDNVQIDPPKGASHRTSPTNVGLYLCALLAAEKLRLLPAREAARRIEEAVETLEALPKWRGHLYNWYDTRTLRPLEPLFVSAVDSGNCAASLLCCAQGLRVLMPELPARFQALPARVDALAEGMDFRPLFDYDAELFSIGAHVDGQVKRAAGHYDLLASESRLLSFVSIMLGQIPVRHWYRLGRTRTRTRRGQTLVSFSGTMFEYMTPLLFQPLVRGTLLEEALGAAYGEQAAYRLGGAFGVSESGYYAFDPNLYYQYKAFGVPALALDAAKSHDVISPYSSVLSLPVGLKGSFANLLRLQRMGLEGPMGFFEAADFCKGRVKPPFQIVRSHMAHHQGMILLSVCNVLCDQYIARLFSDLPRAQAYRLLLEERPGRRRAVIRRPLKSAAKETAPPSLHAERTARPLCFPMDAHVLHGGGTTVMIDAQGGGYMARNGLNLTRFQESCHLPSGMRVYLKDVKTGAYWCVTDPYLNGEVSFETAQAVFRHKRLDVQTELRVFVNPIDGAALHCLTLENTSQKERLLEVCGYLEPTLCSQKDDAAHPAFQNLFLRTSRLQKQGVEALRRSREGGAPVRLWQQLTADVPLHVFHVQTDRTVFLGRGRTVYAPRSLETPLSGAADAVGDMIEPCVSLRAQFRLPAGGRARLAFATLLPGERDTPAAFAERYDRPESALRCYELALTQGLVTARFLCLSAGEQNTISRLTGCLCYTGQPMQFLYAAQNELPLRELWGLGVSGDLPLLLAECAAPSDLERVKLLLKAHAAFHLSGLWVDLAVLCDQPAGYERSLREEVSELARVSQSHDLVGKEGGVHLLERQSLSVQRQRLLYAAARLVLPTGEQSVDERLDALGREVRPRPFYQHKPSWQTPLPAGEELLFFNEFGGFAPSTGNYVVSLPPGRQTPAPWCNPLCSERFGTLAGESGLIFSYAGNSHFGRLTRWPNDSVCPRGDENFFVRDAAHKLLWSLTRAPLGRGLPCRVTYSPGEAVYESAGYGIQAMVHCFTDVEAALGVRVTQLKNIEQTERALTLCHTCAFHPGAHPGGAQLTSLHKADGGLLAENPEWEGTACLWSVDPEATFATGMSVGAFQGLWGVAPAALSAAEPLPNDGGNVAVLCFTVRLQPGESKTVLSALGFGLSRVKLERAIASLRADGATLRLQQVRQYWEKRLGGLAFDLPDQAMEVMLNRWLPYQVRASRLMMRAGFYQAGGAFGFRDQLQDVLSLAYTEPERVREHLLLCAAHQFEEGDVQHWWHAPQYGIRTRVSDDLLFLPYVTAVYVQITSDTGVLNETVPYLHGEPLGENEGERLFTPETSPVAETLFQHCLRAIDRVALGARGLPLMGGGDWNDGMNRVGGENGESVWLGMFLCEVLRRFLPLCPPVIAKRLHDRRTALLAALERHAWDGAWYLRAWYDDGARLGSAANAECRIDVLPQSWAVLSGLDRERCRMAMESVWRTLYDKDAGLLKLFAPPFNGEEAPGYIAGYLPGIRENGGQYTHAVPWAAAAFHQLGQSERAWELLRAILPVRHALTRQAAERYRVEPYALAGDVYANPRQLGRGGWSWYTGSAGWYQTVVLEQLLGLQKTGNTLRFAPVLPREWEGVRLRYRYGSATYHIRAGRDCAFPMADGEQLKDGKLLLRDDGRIHEASFPVRE